VPGSGGRQAHRPAPACRDFFSLLALGELFGFFGVLHARPANAEIVRMTAGRRKRRRILDLRGMVA
jgi:hypothetical protein